MSDPHIIDLSPLLRDLEARIAAADEAVIAARIEAARLRGIHAGVLMAVERANQQPAMTSGE